MKRIIDNVLTILLIVSLMIFMLTFSIGLPIYFRQFYYLHIDMLNLPQTTNLSYDVIKNAYDEVLDFLVFNKSFGVGELSYSRAGKEHFEDCKILFDLNFYALIGSSITVLCIFLLNKVKLIEVKKYFGLDPIFYSSICALIVPLLVGIFAVIDFDTAFNLFHYIFFPGKCNFVFYPDIDEIIKILPVEFFKNCALLIGSSLLILTTIMIILSIIFKRKSIKD